MSSTIYGSIIYKDKFYPFFLEGHRANIVGKAWEYYDAFQDANEEETISGITADNRQIMFLRCKFGRSSLLQKVWFSSIGYILSSGNVGDPYDFTFEKISFYSDAINAFYPPQKAMKTDFNPLNWDGRMTIALKPFEETAISFDYKECKCKLNMSRYVTTQFGKSDIGNINSAFSFELNSAQHNKEFPQYWLALFDFLSFINYGIDINFDKITLSKRREDGIFAHCADAYIFSNREEYTPRPIPNTITIDDIPLDRLEAVFSKIVSLRGTDKRLSSYFPKNYKESLRIDPNGWLVAALNFDGLFASCYPDFKQNSKESFRLAKSAALDALNSVNQSTMSANERKYFDNCRNQIVHYEGLLEEKLNFIVEKYKDALTDILDFNLQKYAIAPNTCGEIYSKYRNKIAHGNIEPIGEKEGAVYKVLQATIYFMLLDGVGLNYDTLRVIAKKLFL